MVLLLACLLAPPAFAQEEDESTSTGWAKILHQEDNAYLFRHNPFYFAYGNPTSKIQLSFRTKIIKDIPLYFAYTQLMFWALQQNSKPFQDLTYNPELFYRLSISQFSLVKSVDFGWMHDSNGKAGDTSRSYNSLYVRLNSEKEYDRWIVRTSLTGAYLHSFDDTNRDIQNYIGPLTLKLSFIQLWDAWIDRSEFSLQATPGGKFAQNLGKGGYQVSWQFRVGKINLVPSFYLQYYTGYAESLLNYNQYVHAFRAGVIF
jgi:phospholipase A1/A2